MSTPKKSSGYFSKIAIGGLVLLVAGAALYFYTISIPSSGVAMAGILTGLLALLGIVLSALGALVAFVFMLLWIRAKSRSKAS